MAADAPHNAERQSDLAVMDANEYKQKRRLERILDAMDNIPDQADRAKEMYFHGEIDEHGRRVLVQDAVKDAIWEAWNLLQDHERKCQERAQESEKDLWHHSEYFFGSDGRGPLGIIEQSQQDDIVIWGLQDFFFLDEVWVETWREEAKQRNGVEEVTERQEKYTVPREISWQAALRLKEFMNDEHDLEITFEALDDKSLPAITGFDQSGDEPEAGITNAQFNRSPDL